MTRPFRFGLQAFEASSGSAWTETARRAEALGYCTLFTTDHHFGPGEISTSSGHRPVDVAPISAMTMAAAVTTTLRVGCRVFCVDYHQPVVLAKELATVDFLTDGRVEAAFGAGWVAAEYEGLGIPMDTAGVRIARLAEWIELVRSWAGNDWGQHGIRARDGQDRQLSLCGRRLHQCRRSHYSHRGSLERQQLGVARPRCWQRKRSRRRERERARGSRQ